MENRMAVIISFKRARSALRQALTSFLSFLKNQTSPIEKNFFIDSLRKGRYYVSCSVQGVALFNVL